MPIIRHWRSLPQLVRFLIAHAVIGFLLSALLVGGLLAADPGNARALLLNAAGHWWPAVVLWFFTGLTFGAVQIGAATMLLEHEDRPGRPRPGTGAPTLLAPSLLRARRR